MALRASGAHRSSSSREKPDSKLALHARTICDGARATAQASVSCGGCGPTRGHDAAHRHRCGSFRLMQGRIGSRQGVDAAQSAKALTGRSQ
eukprot:364553-Chlamydomonas_euryale.AAC.7